MTENKTNHNNKNETEYENTIGEPTYLPSKYAHKGYTDTFYNEKEDSGAGSFLLGAVVGGVIGAATALFLAPKTGKEMRDDLTTQAGQIKEKSIELSTIAKDKATEYSSVAKDKASEYSGMAKDKASEYSGIAKDKASDLASTAKEKTAEVSKTIQEQKGQITDKVKSMKNNGQAVNEKATDIVEEVKEKIAEGEEVVTEMAEALKEEVAKKAEEDKKA